MKEVIYGCKRGLDGRISDCKLGMHAKCFSKYKKALFMMLGADKIVAAINEKCSKADAIIASKICVFHTGCV